MAFSLDALHRYRSGLIPGWMGATGRCNERRGKYPAISPRKNATATDYSSHPGALTDWQVITYVI